MYEENFLGHCYIMAQLINDLRNRIKILIRNVNRYFLCNIPPYILSRSGISNIFNETIVELDIFLIFHETIVEWNIRKHTPSNVDNKRDLNSLRGFEIPRAIASWDFKTEKRILIEFIIK